MYLFRIICERKFLNAIRCCKYLKSSMASCTYDWCSTYTVLAVCTFLIFFLCCFSNHFVKPVHFFFFNEYSSTLAMFKKERKTHSCDIFIYTEKSMRILCIALTILLWFLIMRVQHACVGISWLGKENGY